MSAALIFFLSFFAFSVPGGANAATSAVVKNLEAHYRSARTLEAVFLERYSEGSQTVRVESGNAYFSRPGRMRWDYESPQKKLFLVDGKYAWLYLPADRTATREPVRESDDWRTPLALLTGRANLSRFCGTIQLLPTDAAAPEDRPSSAGNFVLRCTPKIHGNAEPAFQDALLEADSRFRLVRVLIRQAGALQTEFRFGDWRENVPQDESMFHFLPPPGVAIVEAPLPDTAAPH